MNRRVLGVAGLVLTCGLLASGCSGAGAAADGLQIGYIAGATVPIPDVIAEEKGFLTAHHVDVSRVNTNNGPGIVNLVLAGGIDVSWAPTSNVLAAGDKLDVVSGALRSYAFEMIQRTGYDDAAFERAYPASVQGLEGARIGVSATGSYGQVIAEYMLEKAGVDPKSVTFVGVGVEGTALGALRSGQIDLLMAGPVTTAKARVDGTARSLVSALDIPELARLPEDVYVVKRGADEGTRAQVADYLGAIDDAVAWAKDPANEKELGALLARHFDLDGELATAVADEWSPTGGNLIGEFGPAIDRQGYTDINTMLVDNGLLDAAVPYDDLVHPITANATQTQS